METYVCKVCGHIAFNSIPEKCPVCFSPDSAFFKEPKALKIPLDQKNLSELEKKHLPVFKKLSGGDVFQVKVRVGEILHVMEENHYISWIDFYWNQKFIGRYFMKPGVLNPALEIELKNSKGVLMAIENCNLHGRWMGKIEI